MNINTNSSRRSFLVNGGKLTALPFLASLLPSSVRAAQEKSQSPKRLLWMSMGHGHLNEFYPKETGNFRDISMAPAFEPLKKNFGNFSLVSNLSNNKNHESHNGTEALLSCANVNGFPGKSRHNSISCDQVAAKQIGSGTRYQSIQLNTRSDKGNGHGGVAMSYRIDGSALPGVSSPLDFYYMVFGGNLTKEEVAEALKKRKSVLDIMRFEESSHRRLLDKEDRQKLEEYTTSIRDIELEITREKEWVNVPYPKAITAKPNTGLIGEDEVRAMFKILIAAYQVDASRVVTYRLPDAELLQGLGIPADPHKLSHAGTQPALQEYNRIRSKKWMELYSLLIDQLRQTKDPLDPKGGTLYDNSMVYMGGGLRNNHVNKNVPCLLTGGGFKTLQHGKHRNAAEKNTPLANLWTTMLKDAGCKIDRFADANGLADSIWT